MKTCDVCNCELRLLRFRYRDGLICKKCYEKASQNCIEPIRQIDLGEIKKRCSVKEPDFDDFEITGRVGNYVLIDNHRKKICIVNNRLQVNGNLQPEIISLKDIHYCRICCDSSCKWEELQSTERIQKGYVSCLKLELYMNSKSGPKYIKILSSPVRIKSFALRKSMDFIQQIVEYLKINGVECRFG